MSELTKKVFEREELGLWTLTAKPAGLEVDSNRVYALPEDVDVGTTVERWLLQYWTWSVDHPEDVYTEDRDISLGRALSEAPRWEVDVGQAYERHHTSEEELYWRAEWDEQWEISTHLERLLDNVPVEEMQQVVPVLAPDVEEAASADRCDVPQDNEDLEVTHGYLLYDDLRHTRVTSVSA